MVCLSRCDIICHKACFTKSLEEQELKNQKKVGEGVILLLLLGHINLGKVEFLCCWLRLVRVVLNERFLGLSLIELLSYLNLPFSFRFSNRPNVSRTAVEICGSTWREPRLETICKWWGLGVWGLDFGFWTRLLFIFTVSRSGVGLRYF